MNLRFATRFLCAITIACSAATSRCDAQTLPTTTIVNDNFAVAGTPTDAQFFSTAGSSQTIEFNAGSLGFITGTSGRAFHGVFAPQTLTNVGESIELSFDFTTPDSVGTDEVFRYGLFNTATNPNTTQADFLQNVPSTSFNPNPLLGTSNVINGAGLQLIDNVGPAGVFGEIIVNPNNLNAGFELRTHNVNNDTSGLSSLPSGRLLATNAGFDRVAFGPRGFSITPNTDYTGTLSIGLVGGGLVDVTQSLFSGGSGNSFTATGVSIADIPTQIGVNTTTFDLLAFSATGDAFGDSNAADTLNNGIDFTNISVNFTGETTTVPEPGSAALLLGGLCSLGLVRRRNS